MALSDKHITLGVVLVAVAAAVGLYIWHNSQKSVKNDGDVQMQETQDYQPQQSDDDQVGQVAPDASTMAAQAEPRNSAGMIGGAGGDGVGNDMAPIGQNQNDMKSMDAAAQQLRQASCFPREQLMPEELLPQDNSSTWAQVNPQGQGSLKDKNFLQAGYASGVNTVGSSLRNANLQLRSDIPNPQVPVSPWMNTTIEPDTGRRPLAIGGCA